MDVTHTVGIQLQEMKSQVKIGKENLVKPFNHAKSYSSELQLCMQSTTYIIIIANVFCTKASTALHSTDIAVHRGKSKNNSKLCSLIYMWWLQIMCTCTLKEDGSVYFHGEHTCREVFILLNTRPRLLCWSSKGLFVVEQKKKNNHISPNLISISYSTEHMNSVRARGKIDVQN